jgi:acetoin utilization protein AcuB
MKRHQSLVQDIMTPNPVVIDPGATLHEAYNLMFDEEVRRLPVIADRELVGIITLSDILQAMPRALDDTDRETQLKMAGCTVGEVMSYDPITVTPEDTVQEAAARMLEYQISGLPVVQDGETVGIITESDIFRMIVDAWAAEPA